MDKNFIVQRDGKDFVLYAGLLDLAHDQGLESIQTTLVQVPTELNMMTAICHATVVTSKGRFDGIGDANPTNVTRMMAPHIMRMAETRAKARALRDAVNIGTAALEELGDHDDDAPVPVRSPGVATIGAARIDADRRPRPAPVIHEPWPQDDAPHPADMNGAGPTPIRQANGSPGGPPATPRQLETLAKFRVPVTDGLTRAAASELISRALEAKGAER